MRRWIRSGAAPYLVFGTAPDPSAARTAGLAFPTDDPHATAPQATFRCCDRDVIRIASASVK